MSRVLGVGVDDNASFRLVGDFRFGNRDQALTIDEFNRTLSDPNEPGAVCSANSEPKESHYPAPASSHSLA